MIYKINNLSFSYDNKNEVLKNISLNINKGDLITLLGKNGSGKTTLFNILIGINKGYKGSIILNNKELSSLKERDIAKLVGYVPQSHDYEFGFTVLEYVILGLAPKIGLFSSPNKNDEAEAIKILESLELYHLKDKDYSELSGGERQQVTIARALMSNPDVLILDEPLAHLDLKNQIKVLKMISELNKKGYTIILSTHDPNHALLLKSKVALIDEHNLIYGSSNEIITEEKISNIYGENIKIRFLDEFNEMVCFYKL